MFDHGHLTQEKQREDSCATQARHRLPYDGHARGKGLADLRLQRLVELVDGRDGGVRNLHARRELGGKRFGKPMLQLVLQDRTRDRDAPSL